MRAFDQEVKNYNIPIIQPFSLGPDIHKICADKTRKCGKLGGKCSVTTVCPQTFKRHIKKEKSDNIKIEGNVKPNKTTGCKQDNPEASEGSNLLNGLKESSLEALKKSVNVESTVYRCIRCNYQSKSYSKYVFHLKNVHDSNFICDTCHRGYKHKFALKSHMLIHCDDRKFVCDVCQKGFTRKDVLTRHKQVHCDTKDYICHICQGCFKYHRNLSRHLETHRTDKSFVCNICPKVFKTKSYLREHIRKHSTDRKYSCNVCEKAFTTRYTLGRHHITHSN